MTQRDFVATRDLRGLTAFAHNYVANMQALRGGDPGPTWADVPNRVDPDESREPRMHGSHIQLPPGWWDIETVPSHWPDPLPPDGVYSLGLVGCSKRKRPTALPLPAAELYAGTLFQRGYRHSVAHHDLTLILSGHHGLVAPDALLEPYDYVLPQHRGIARHWAIFVLAQLDPIWRNPEMSLHHIYLYAGRRYAEPLLDLVAQYRLFAGVTWHWPVKGLSIQEQVRWFASQADQEPKGT